MAKLKEIDVFALNDGQIVTVGHNRQVRKHNSQNFVCYLHGHPIAFFSNMDANGMCSVTLDHCGFQTVTTAAAMRDFLRFFGVSGGVSMARGKFWARWKCGTWHERDCEPGSTQISFIASRYEA